MSKSVRVNALTFSKNNFFIIFQDNMIFISFYIQIKSEIDISWRIFSTIIMIQLNLKFYELNDNLLLQMI